MAALTVGLLVLAFLAGAWVALVARALIAQSAQRRISTAAEDTLTPGQMTKLRAYIAEIDEHERQRVIR